MSTPRPQDMSDWFDQNIERVAFRLELHSNGREQLLWKGTNMGETVLYNHEPGVGFLRRLWIGFMSLRPIDSTL